MKTSPKLPALFFILLLGGFLIVSLVSCTKTVVTQVYGTYIGTSTNTGIVSGAIADTFVISAHSSTANDSVNVLEKAHAVNLVGTVSSNNDTLYINSQPVVYAGDSVVFTGTTGSISGGYLTVSISEAYKNGTNAGTLVFEGQN